MTSESVRQAAAQPDMNHRDPAFIEILHDTRKRLLRVYPEMQQDAWVSYLIGGSGTAAVEAMITSCVRTGPVLLIDSGYYSGRMRSKLDAHEIPYEVFDTDSWLAPIDLNRLENEIAVRATTGSPYEAVITTHHETTVGRLHPLGDIGQICFRAQARLLVDAMSSFGADDIDVTHVDAIASSANKCLHGLPGLSFVLVRDWLADEIREYPQRSVYLSLPFYEGESPPLTPPVPILAALREALVELGPKGAAGRRAVYSRRAATLRQGLRERGFDFALPERDFSCSVTTASLPPGWTGDKWFDSNLEAGFMIYGTKGALHDRWFQVANMGEIKEQHLLLWLASVDDAVSRR
jgi:2-aminoethylphosphonate-pyruvate transaminase